MIIYKVHEITEFRMRLTETLMLEFYDSPRHPYVEAHSQTKTRMIEQKKKEVAYFFDLAFICSLKSDLSLLCRSIIS